MPKIDVRVSKLKNVNLRRVIGFRARLGDVYADAKTSQEAVSGLKEKIDRLTTRDNSAYRVIQFKNWYAVIFRDLDGFNIIGHGPEYKISWSAPADSTLDKEERALRAHIARQSYPDPDAVNAILDFKGATAETDLTDFRNWIEFQVRYSDAIAAGLNSNDAHSYAGRNPARPDLWKDGNYIETKIEGDSGMESAMRGAL